MHMQIVCKNTKLSGLNGGRGVADGTFTIISSSGTKGKIDLTGGDIETVGDLIDAVDRLGIRVTAEINATGDGILIRDLDNAGQELRIVEGSGSTAADLHLLGEASEIERGGRTFKVVDGSMTQTITLDEDDSLEDLQNKINELAAGARATIFNDGSNRPYRLSLGSDRMGEQGQLVVDTSGLNLTLMETAEARDALMVYGSPDNPANGILVSSSSNKFTDVLPGLDLEIKDTSGQAVMISVVRSDKDAVANVEAMVQKLQPFPRKAQRIDQIRRNNRRNGPLGRRQRRAAAGRRALKNAHR